MYADPGCHCMEVLRCERERLSKQKPWVFQYKIVHAVLYIKRDSNWELILSKYQKRKILI